MGQGPFALIPVKSWAGAVRFNSIWSRGRLRSFQMGLGPFEIRKYETGTVYVNSRWGRGLVPAHSPSQTPLSCSVAPPSQQHELHKDGGGGGGEEGARRPGPEGQVLWRVLWHVLRNVLRSALRCVLFVLVLHVSPKGKHGGPHACVGCGSLRVGLKAALAADRTSPGIGLVSGWHALGAARACLAWVRRPPWPRTGPLLGSVVVVVAVVVRRRSILGGDFKKAHCRILGDTHGHMHAPTHTHRRL